MYLKIKEGGHSKRVLKVNRMKQYVKLNNETYEVKKVKGELLPLEYRSLFDCYNRPSDIKQSIWKQWIA